MRPTVGGNDTAGRRGEDEDRHLPVGGGWREGASGWNGAEAEVVAAVLVLAQKLRGDGRSDRDLYRISVSGVARCRNRKTPPRR